MAALASCAHNYMAYPARDSVQVRALFQRIAGGVAQTRINEKQLLRFLIDDQVGGRATEMQKKLPVVFPKLH